MELEEVLRAECVDDSAIDSGAARQAATGISASGHLSAVTDGGISSGGQFPSTHIIVSSRRLESNESTHGRRPRLRDVAHILRRSDRFSEVTMEQVERVRNMHEQFREASEFTFNFNALLLVSSVLAGLGLASNSSTTVIASMLVSPLMGPVVGMAYGATIQDWRLFRTSMKTELLSLLFCVGSGAVIGAITGKTGLAEEWPTQEMKIRGTLQNLYVGLPTAFFSGLGVAVSLLDQQTSSLVGVAISASLLPPAVNCGLSWVAFAFFKPGIFDEKLTAQDFRQAGIVSLGLTLANIVLIIIASMLMFRAKERLPVAKSPFWNDLGIARKIYRNLAVMPAAAQEDLYPVTSGEQPQGPATVEVEVEDESIGNASETNQ